MKPAFRVIADGRDLTAAIADRLLSLRVTDEAGLAADQFEMSLDDRDGAIAIPPTGAALSVSLGYVNQPLFDMGRYSADEIEISGPPATLSIRGKAADMIATLKSWKKRDWHKTTLGALLEKIASEHGLAPAIAAEYRTVKIDHLDQTYESDLNLITRLAEQYGAVAKPAGGRLVFVRRGAAADAAGQRLPTQTIAHAELIDWRAAVHERQFYARVGAHWQDKRGAKVQYVYAGEGEPVMYLRTPYKSQSDALSAAEAKLRQLRRGSTSLSLSLCGRPALCAEMPIRITGLRDGTAGDWIVTRAEHTLDASGLTTRIEAQRPDDFLDAGKTAEGA